MAWRRLIKIRAIAQTTDMLWLRFHIDFVDLTVLLVLFVVLCYWCLRWLIGVNKRSLSTSAVVVTSAAGPIGIQCVQQLVERSDVDHVFACVAGQDDRSELEIMGSSVQIITLDPKDSKTIDSAFVEVSLKIKELSVTLDGVVIVCSSVPLIGPVHHIKTVRLKNQFEVESVGLVSVVQKFLPLLRSDLRNTTDHVDDGSGSSSSGSGSGSGSGNRSKSIGGGGSGSGRIVCVFNPGSTLPGAFAGGPSAVKAATVALIDSLRQEIRPTGVDVVTITPEIDVFTPYLGTRGYALAKASNRDITRKDSTFGLLFDRFLERHHTSIDPSKASTSKMAGNMNFVESELPMLLSTAQATLAALQHSFPAPCSIAVSDWSTQCWRRRIRCLSDEAIHAEAMSATMRPIATDLLKEYQWCPWLLQTLYRFLWWCVVALVVSYLFV